MRCWMWALLWSNSKRREYKNTSMIKISGKLMLTEQKILESIRTGWIACSQQLSPSNKKRLKSACYPWAIGPYCAAFNLTSGKTLAFLDLRELASMQRDKSFCKQKCTTLVLIDSIVLETNPLIWSDIQNVISFQSSAVFTITNTAKKLYVWVCMHVCD